MRVFLKEAQTIKQPSGATTTYAIGEDSEGAFYEVDNDLGEKWIKEGAADRATKDNVRIKAPEPKPTKADKPKRAAPSVASEK